MIFVVAKTNQLQIVTPETAFLNIADGSVSKSWPLCNFLSVSASHGDVVTQKKSVDYFSQANAIQPNVHTYE